MIRTRYSLSEQPFESDLPAMLKEKYDLEAGKGNACVEFEVEPELLRVQYNRRLQMDEVFIVGDVDLNGRNAVGLTNY
jgi:hypothetical protein